MIKSKRPVKSIVLPALALLTESLGEKRQGNQDYYSATV